MLRAIVFDLDDTLYPEREFVHSGFRAVAERCSKAWELDAETVFRTLVELAEQDDRSRTFDQLLTRFDRPTREGDVQRLVSIYREHSPRIAPYPGISELLRRLNDTFALGLVSDGNLEVQRRKWKALGLDRYFAAVVFSDELGRDHWKPSKEPFVQVLRLLGVEPRSAVYVGENSLKDFLGARQTGMHTIRVLEPAGYYTMADPPSAEHAADLTITSLEDLETTLEQLVSGERNG